MILPHRLSDQRREQIEYKRQSAVCQFLTTLSWILFIVADKKTADKPLKRMASLFSLHFNGLWAQSIDCDIGVDREQFNLFGSCINSGL